MVPDNNEKNGPQDQAEGTPNDQSQHQMTTPGVQHVDAPTHAGDQPRGPFTSVSDEVTKIVHRDALMAQDPERKEPLTLDELTSNMFESPTVKKLLIWTKAIGTTGTPESAKPAPANPETSAVQAAPVEPTVGQLVEDMKANSVSGERFAELALQLFNGILKKKFREEDVQFETRDFVFGLGGWLHFSIELPTQGNLDPNNPANASKLEEAKIVIENFLHNDVFGYTYEERSKNLLSAARSPEIDNLLRSIVKDYLDGQSRRNLIGAQREVKKDFSKFVEGFGLPEEQEAGQEPGPAADPDQSAEPRQPDTGDAEQPEQSAQTGAALLDEAIRAAAAAQQMAQLESRLEQTNIRRANVQIIMLRKEDNYEKAIRLTVTRNGERVDPSIEEGQKLPLRIKSKEQSTAPLITLEIEKSKVVLINHGNGTVIDMDAGMPVHKIELSRGKPVRIQVGEERFQISISGIERETMRPGAPLKSEVSDSQPDIESSEVIRYMLPGVMRVDEKGVMIDSYPCLDEKDRVVSIGAALSNDIVIPRTENAKACNVEFLFLSNGVIFVRGKDTYLTFKNRLNTFFEPMTNQKFDEENNDIVQINSNGNSVYFKASKEHPFTEADVKKSLHERIAKIGKLLDECGGDLQELNETEKLIKNFEATLALYEEKFDTSDLISEHAALYGKAYKAKQDVSEQEVLKQEAKRLEEEFKKLARQHYDIDSGETVDTPRPFKYPALVDKIESERKGKKILHVIFPGGLTVGKDKVNTLEPRPTTERVSKYNVQDNECTFVLEGEKVRMVIEPRVDRKSKIMVNGQIPGTRAGEKIHELDMLRVPLKDDDIIEIGLDRYQMETNHEFTAGAIKPYAAEFIDEIMEVLVLYPDRGDKGDKRNAQETLDHFLQTGLVAENEVNKKRAAFAQEKLARELSQEAMLTLSKIRGENESLENFVHTEGAEVGLPYDAPLFRKALELTAEPALRWEDMGWLLDEFRNELKRSATVRFYAYDKQLFSIREKMNEPNRIARLKALVSNDAEENLAQMQQALQVGLRKILVEMISLAGTDLLGDEYNNQWFYSRLTTDQYPQVIEIDLVQKFLGQIHEAKTFNINDIAIIRRYAQGKTYGDFMNFNEVGADTPMDAFILTKIKAYAKKLLEEANEGDNISRNLDRIEALIDDGLVTFEKLETSPEDFTDLRHNEGYFTKCKAGARELFNLVSSGEPKLEDILAFAKCLENEEIDLSDEKEEEFKAYCRMALQAAVQKARIGEMTSYFAVLASTAVRLKLAKPGEFGSTDEELDQFHEEAEVSSEIGEMQALVDEARAANPQNLHPLLKLKNYLEQQQPVSLKREGKTGEHILDELVSDRLEKMLLELNEGEDTELLQMVVDDMRAYGLAPMIQKAVNKEIDSVLEALVNETQTAENVRPFIETLRQLNLGDLMDNDLGNIVDKYSKIIYEMPDNVERLKKFGEDLQAVGLYGGTV